MPFLGNYPIKYKRGIQKVDIEIIERLRKQLNLTTQEFSDLCGIDRKSYYNYSSKNQFPVETLAVFALSAIRAIDEEAEQKKKIIYDIIYRV